ncbi:hypothetical protein ACLOJK_013114 [Asimina triloba]
MPPIAENSVSRRNHCRRPNLELNPRKRGIKLKERPVQRCRKTLTLGFRGAQANTWWRRIRKLVGDGEVATGDSFSSRYLKGGTKPSDVDAPCQLETKERIHEENLQIHDVHQASAIQHATCIRSVAIARVDSNASLAKEILYPPLKLFTQPQRTECIDDLRTPEYNSSR